MEPIRPKETGRFRRRTKSDGASSASVHSEAFQRKLTETAESVDASGTDEVSGATGAEVLAGLPGVDAPTERLFDAVHEAGQRLLDERSWTAAQHYREAVRRFLGRVLASANAVEVHESRKDILTRKRYFLLTEINQSVDRLLDGLVRTQMKQMDILARLEEIEGMLINLFH